GVAVTAFEGHGNVDFQRRATVTLGDDPAAGSEKGRHVELRTDATGLAVWRVEEDKIVGLPRRACFADEGAGVAGMHRRIDTQGSEVAGQRLQRGRRALDEDRARGAARERLDSQRTGAREQVE